MEGKSNYYQLVKRMKLAKLFIFHRRTCDA